MKQVIKTNSSLSSTSCSDDNICKQLIEYANRKNQKMIYLFSLDELVCCTQSVEYTIYVIEVLRKKEIFLCFMEEGLRTDRLEQDTELKENIYSAWFRLLNVA